MISEDANTLDNGNKKLFKINGFDPICKMNNCVKKIT